MWGCGSSEYGGDYSVGRRQQGLGWKVLPSIALERGSIGRWFSPGAGGGGGGGGGERGVAAATATAAAARCCNACEGCALPTRSPVNTNVKFDPLAAPAVPDDISGCFQSTVVPCIAATACGIKPSRRLALRLRLALQQQQRQQQ